MNIIKASGPVDRGIDFTAHYRVGGYNGIAFRLVGWFAEMKPEMLLATDDDGNEVEFESDEWELVSDYGSVVAVMVGDDRRHKVDKDDLLPLAEDAFCRSCGQVGCGCNIYE